MVVFFLLILALAFGGCRLSVCDFRADYLDKRCTTAVNGVFILWVFLRHAWGYVIESGYKASPVFDKLFVTVDDLFAQRIVVLFLFFSGFGVMESIQKKGDSYVTTLPKRRILATLLNFDVAVLAFALVGICLRGWSAFDIRQLILAFTGWTSIGNSNWYIFDILICYLGTYVVCCIPALRRCRAWGVLGVTGLFVVGLYLTKPGWWYDTLLAYPLGALFSQHRARLEPVLKRHYWVLLILSGVVVVVYKFIPVDMCGFKQNISTFAFATGAVLVLMKVSVWNPVLEWLGTRLFPLYVYQRLPMIVLVAFMGPSYVARWPHAFVGLSLVLTVGIAAVYDKFKIKVGR